MTSPSPVATSQIRRRESIDGLDLSVVRGDCFGLPNDGAGRRLRSRFWKVSPNRLGEVRSLDMSWRENDATCASAGHLARDNSTTSCVLRYAALFLRLSQRPSPDAVLRDLSLDAEAHARVGKRSGGPKQRLAASCALVATGISFSTTDDRLDPEPFAAWARSSLPRGRQVPPDHAYMEEAERLCDNIAIATTEPQRARHAEGAIAKLSGEHHRFTSIRRSDGGLASVPGFHGCTPAAGLLLRFDSLLTCPAASRVIERRGASCARDHSAATLEARSCRLREGALMRETLRAPSEIARSGVRARDRSVVRSSGFRV